MVLSGDSYSGKAVHSVVTTQLHCGVFQQSFIVCLLYSDLDMRFSRFYMVRSNSIYLHCGSSPLQLYSDLDMRFSENIRYSIHNSAPISGASPSCTTILWYQQYLPILTCQGMLPDSYYQSFAIQLRWVFTSVTNGTSSNEWLKLKKKNPIVWHIKCNYLIDLT